MEHDFSGRILFDLGLFWREALHELELGLTMTSKEKVIAVLNSLDDDVSLDDVIDRLYLLRKIELTIAQADAGGN